MRYLFRMQNGLSYHQAACEADYERVRRIAESVWPECYSAILSQDQISYMLDKMYSTPAIENDTASGTPFFIVGIGNEDAALVSFDLKPDSAGVVRLHKLYLLGKFHGLGYGQMLLDHVADAAKAAGASAVELCVNKHNSPALKAYKRNGFVVSRAVVTQFGGGYVMDDYVMRRTLRQNAPGITVRN